MNKVISIEVIEAKGQLTYLHGSDSAVKNFKTWLDKRNVCLSKENSLLINKKFFKDYLLEAIICGLKPSREETFSHT